MTALDTNILIYACDRADPRKQGIAQDLIAAARDGVLLWQVACEFLAASRKLEDQGFSALAAHERLSELLQVFPLVLPTPTLLSRVRELHLGRRISFWDALVMGACLEAGVRRLYSEDLPGLSVLGGLEILNPFA